MTDNKNYVRKGLWLGFILIVIHKTFLTFFSSARFYEAKYYFMVGTTFGLVVFFFVVSEKLNSLFTTGFTGLGTLIGVEIFVSKVLMTDILFEVILGYSLDWSLWFEVYFVGFVGSVIGAVTAIVLTALKIKLNFLKKREGEIMEKSLKSKLLVYLVVSALSFSYLILPENAGISAPIFAVLQFVCLWFVVPNRKRLWLFAPVFILSINSFISGNTMWRIPNAIISIILYSVMFIDFDIKDTSLKFLSDILGNVIEPTRHFGLPYKWALDVNKEKAPVIKRVLIALAITLPSLIIVLALLSNADMVFSQGVSSFFSELFKYINFNAVLKVIFGIGFGLYLFGVVYISYLKKDAEDIQSSAKQGDLIILNVLLFSILAVYTLFAVIQFRYLFAGQQLPYGLDYTQYARKGFFELLFLSGLNIMLILISVSLTNMIKNKWAGVTKVLCCYLCIVTIILLISSFYRMLLYSYDDGLTRLRLLVFGFLIFESLGLVVTFFYIIKPKFNIAAVYLSIALVYYLILNITPIDSIIAKNQVNRYLLSGKNGIDYTITLSTDAAPEIARLLASSGVDEVMQEKAKLYFGNVNKYYGDFVPRWQRYNLSVSNAMRLTK